MKTKHLLLTAALVLTPGLAVGALAQPTELVTAPLVAAASLETPIVNKKCTKDMNNKCWCTEPAAYNCYYIYDQSENAFACYDDMGATCTPPPGPGGSG